MPALDPITLIFILAGMGLFLIVFLSGVFTLLACWCSWRSVKLCSDIVGTLRILTETSTRTAEKLDDIYDKQNGLNMEILKCRTS